MDNNDKVELDRIKFINKALKQLLYKFGLSKDKPENFNELTLAILLHITAYQYDDREPLNLTELEKRKIVDKCILGPGDYRTNNSIDSVTNLRVGTIKASRVDTNELNRLYQKRFDSLDGYYDWGKKFMDVVLSNTRNSIAHGFFELDNIDGVDVVRIQNRLKNFVTTYELDCLIDSCKDISDPKVKDDYNVLLNSTRDQSEFEKTFSLDEEKNQLMFYDLLTNILINYNEKKVYDTTTNYRRAVKNLYLKQFPNLINLVTDADFVKKIRNSATHHYRKIDPGNPKNILVVDYEKKGDIDPNFVAPIPFNEIKKFAEKFSIYDVIEEKQKLDQQILNKTGKTANQYAQDIIKSRDENDDISLE